MKNKIVQLLKQTLTLRTQHRQTTIKEGVSTTVRPEKWETLTASLEMDQELFEEYVRRAAQNKSGKTKVGPFTIEILKRTPVQ